MFYLPKFLKAPSAKVLAQQELEDSQRELLAYQRSAEYNAQMVLYLQKSIERLQSYVKEVE